MPVATSGARWWRPLPETAVGIIRTHRWCLLHEEYDELVVERREKAQEKGANRASPILRRLIWSLLGT